MFRRVGIRGIRGVLSSFLFGSNKIAKEMLSVFIQMMVFQAELYVFV